MDMENSVSDRHSIEQGNDLTERVITSRDCHSLIIAVSNHIGRVYVVEHSLGLLGSKQDSHGSDIGILVLVRVDPFERSVGKQTLDEHGVVWVNRRFVVHSLLSLP